MEFSERSLRPFSAVLHLSCAVYAIATQRRVLGPFLREWRVLAPAAGLPWAAGILSGALATLLRLRAQEVKAVVINIVCINMAVAVILLRNTLPQPESDIASAVPLISFVLSPLPLYLFGLFVTLKQFHADRVAARRKVSGQVSVVTLETVNVSEGSRDQDDLQGQSDDDDDDHGPVEQEELQQLNLEPSD